MKFYNFLTMKDIISLRCAKSEREEICIKLPFANKISPELLEKIRRNYSPKDIKPNSRPVRVIKKPLRNGKSKDQADPGGKD